MSVFSVEELKRRGQQRNNFVLYPGLEQEGEKNVHVQHMDGGDSTWVYKTMSWKRGWRSLLQTFDKTFESIIKVGELISIWKIKETATTIYKTDTTDKIDRAGLTDL